MRQKNRGRIWRLLWVVGVPLMVCALLLNRFSTVEFVIEQVIFWAGPIPDVRGPAKRIAETAKRLTALDSVSSTAHFLL